ARQFANRHVDQVALLKSLGATSGRVRRLYFGQLFILAVLASLAGLLMGEAMQRSVAEALWRTYQIRLGAGTRYPYLISLGSGLICLLCFALPSLWFLPYVPPMKILRRELAVNRLQVWLQVALAFFAILLL